MSKLPHPLQLAPRLRPYALLKWAAHKSLALAGWRIEGTPPPVPRFVIIGAYHTSHWDGILMLMAGFAYGIKFYWMGKDGLFNKPWGPLLRWSGGVPIKREIQSNTVQQIVEIIKRHSEFAMIIAPEGTLGPTSSWKTGFYYIAHQAQVPIVFGFLDYRRKVIGLGPDLLMPSGDIERDFAIIREFYAQVTPRFPERKGTIAVEPPEDRA